GDALRGGEVLDPPPARAPPLPGARRPARRARVAAEHQRRRECGRDARAGTMTAPRRVRLSPGSGGPHRLLRSAPLSASSPAVKRPGMVTAAALVTLCVVAGLYWPSAGDGLARLLFAGLALGFIAFRAYQVIPPVRSHPDSPFDRDAPPQETTAVPLPLARIDRAVGADDRRSGTTTGRI